jgi:hypothetical protein
MAKACAKKLKTTSRRPNPHARAHGNTKPRNTPETIAFATLLGFDFIKSDTDRNVITVSGGLPRGGCRPA